MSISVNRITNANIYVNGLSCLGMAEEVTIPRPKAKMEEHKGLGMVGTGEFPAGLDKLEAKIKWVSLYLAPELMLGSPYTVNRYQIRGNLENYTPLGLASQTPVTVLMSGPMKDLGELKFAQHKNVDVTTTVTVYHAEQYIGGIQVFLYDLFSNTFVVDGVDQLAQFRANIGESLIANIASAVGLF
jgi:uncharacterized protein